MKNNTYQVVATIFLLIIILLPFAGLAQDGPGGDLPGDPGTPIDGGASLLVGAAAVYGIKKVKDRRKKTKA